MITINYLHETSKYYNEVNSVIETLENKYPIEILFGGIYSSIATGLANETSDLDILVFFRIDTTSLNISKPSENNFFESAMNMPLIDIRLFDKDISDMPYEDQFNKYGYMMPNTLRLNKPFDNSWLPGIKNFKLTTIIGNLLFHRMIFDKQRFLFKHLNELSHLMNIYSFLKARYIYAYGRLMYYLIEQGNVRVRSYLYAIHDLLIIDYFLNENIMPPCQFIELVEYCKDKIVVNKVEQLYHLNKEPIRSKNHLINPIPELNAYIGQQLEIMKPKLIEIYNTRREETFDVVNIPQF